MSDRNSDNSDTQPQVYKQEELDLMFELIAAGVWRTTNLSKTLNVDMDTITAWKKRPEVIDARRKALLKFVKRRTDVEKILSELDFETPAEAPRNLTLIYQPIFGGLAANGLPANVSNAQDLQPEKES